MSDTRALPQSYLFGALASMVLLHLFVPVLILIPYPWNAAGLVPLALGMALNISADKALKTTGAIVKPFGEPTALVTTGVFRISRNPMYLGMALIVAGAAFLMGSLTPFIIVPVFAIALDRIFITVEEHMLGNRFGGEWQRYKASVRRWL